MHHPVKEAISKDEQDPFLHPTGGLGEGTDAEPFLFLLPTADKGSWCERQLCACDKEVALCLKQNLDSYNKRLRYYWRPHCKGQTPTC